MAGFTTTSSIEYKRENDGIALNIEMILGNMVKTRRAGNPNRNPSRATRFFSDALIQCQPLVKDLHGAEPYSPTCFGESLIRTKRVNVASSKQLPLAPIDEKEIELEKFREDFDPLTNPAFPLKSRFYAESTGTNSGRHRGQGIAKILIKVGFSSSLAFLLASALRAFFTTGRFLRDQCLNGGIRNRGNGGSFFRGAHNEAGPSRQAYVVISQSFEASMRNRILLLEQDDSPYLLGKVSWLFRARAKRARSDPSWKKNLLREERSKLRKGASEESIKRLLIRYELRALRHSESHVRQLNAPRGAVEELRDLLEHKIGLCIDLPCAKSKGFVPMEIPFGLIPYLMTKGKSAWRKVKIGGSREKFPSGCHTFSKSKGIQCLTTDSSRNFFIEAEPGMANLVRQGRILFQESLKKPETLMLELTNLEIFVFKLQQPVIFILRGGILQHESYVRPLESEDPRRRDDPKARMKLEPLLDQERERISQTFPGPVSYEIPSLAYGVKVFFGLFQFYFFFINQGDRELLPGGDTHLFCPDQTLPKAGSESIGTIAVAYNFGPNGWPINLSEWGIPVGNNHGSSCGTTGPGEDNLLFLLLFLGFEDGGTTVGPTTSLSRLASLSTAHLSSKEDDYMINFTFHGELVVPYLLPVSYVRNQSLTLDSYTIPEDGLELGQLRLLKVDNRVVVPAKSHLHIIVTSADVLDSWDVPSLGVKCDKDRPTVDPTLAQPHHPGCEPLEKQAITAYSWSSMVSRSKAIDKIEEGVRLSIEQSIRPRLSELLLAHTMVEEVP
uniref:Cytochrome c oxidase polypeptide II n=1 Tax=Tanacetum cinerariifolium TaxID=118510 RepID=A0A6L2KVG3_TANCI|nr:cytochrome c oxidase subunit 2, mitochondrial [Tanacetum cinerariifolium]